MFDHTSPQTTEREQDKVIVRDKAWVKVKVVVGDKVRGEHDVNKLSPVCSE